MQVTGDFGNHDAVRICDGAGQEVGRGLSNYARDEVAKLMVRTADVGVLIGYTCLSTYLTLALSNVAYTAIPPMLRLRRARRRRTLNSCWATWVRTRSSTGTTSA